MEVQEIVDGARDALTVKRVFGDPYEKNGVTVIPAASVRGGAGGGSGEGPEGTGKGGGGGFGLTARPAGAYVIRGDQVTWQPAVDVNRIVLGAQIVALAALLTVQGTVEESSLKAQVRARAFRTDRWKLALLPLRAEGRDLGWCDAGRLAASARPTRESIHSRNARA